MGIFSKVILGIQRVKRREVLFHLRGMSERQLIDCGFSPELLEQGLKGWPWRTDELALKPLSLTAISAEEQRNIDELKAYSDSELADLGISRSRVKEAVLYGRPGIDRPITDKAA